MARGWSDSTLRSFFYVVENRTYLHLDIFQTSAIDLSL